jgi:hypothetical protein
MKRLIVISSLLALVTFGSLFEAIVRFFQPSSQVQSQTDIGVRIDPDGSPSK